jgi:hypothetical protein
MSSYLSQHKLWNQLHNYIKIETYSPDGGHARPRIRIEWNPMPPALRRSALAASMSCVACGSAIQFVRARKQPPGRGTPGALYYAPTCPLNVNMGCSRGAAVRDEYLAVRAECGYGT